MMQVESFQVHLFDGFTSGQIEPASICSGANFEEYIKSCKIPILLKINHLD